MKGLLLIFSLLICASGFAQDTISEKGREMKAQMVSSASEVDGDPSFFTLEDQEFKFVPNQLGFDIMKIENGNEVDYGTLLLTSEDGYYAMTSNLNDHVSYGRFDDSGNFKALRYDEEADTVLEENFVRDSGGEK